MNRVALDEIEPAVISTATDRRALGDELGTTDVGMAYYEVAPGERFSGLYHTHYDQEEVFYVRSGTATFRTEDGPVEVGAGEAVRFAPGEYQQGYNEGDDPVVALALGAPGPTHSHEHLEARVECPDCGTETPHDVALTDSREGVVLTCQDCGTEGLKTHRRPGTLVRFAECTGCGLLVPERRDDCPECRGSMVPAPVPDDWPAVLDAR